MKLRLITRRYSEAFVDYSKDTLGLDEAVEEINLLKHILKQSPELRNILLSPELSVGEKFDFIDETLKDYFSEEVILFLKLVIERGRSALFADMLDYITTTYSHLATEEVLLKYAFPLEPEALEKIKRKLEAKLEKKLHLVLQQDPGILAGVQVVIGNKIIDGSLKGRLDDLKENLTIARVG
jgi:F-type H+-transporting ATPase subunit delta